MNKKRNLQDKVIIVMEFINTGISAVELCRKHNISPTIFQDQKDRFMQGDRQALLHKVAILRRIRQKLVTVGGKIMLGTIMTCLFTWNRMVLNWFEKLSEAFRATCPLMITSLNDSAHICQLM